jgi:hypothetical protein
MMTNDRISHMVGQALVDDNLLSVDAFSDATLAAGAAGTDVLGTSSPPRRYARSTHCARSGASPEWSSSTRRRASGRRRRR